MENSIEKDKEILNNIKAYMQENIDKGFHKFVYNDLGYDEKCIDVINAIEHILSDYKRVLKENEQLSTEVNSLKEENNVVNKEKADWIKAYREEKDLKENYIQKVKNKMEKDIKTNEHTILGRRNGKTLEYGRRLGRIEMCKELLEGEK